jgi:large subunit ribosomal protein L18
MNKKLKERRKKKVRAKIFGTSSRPRLNVFRSNQHIYAHLIDDEKGTTLLSVSEGDLKSKEKLTKVEKAFRVGKLAGEKSIAKGLKKVVFDRSGYLYHGRVKGLAQGAREAGLEF